MKRDLKEKIAWIVGAGSGIGQKTAIKLSTLVMKLILSGRNIKNLEETSKNYKTKKNIIILKRLNINKIINLFLQKLNNYVFKLKKTNLINNFRHIGAASRATKSSAAPTAPGDKLERTCGNFLTRPRNANDY